jgi:hypothetical protein
MRRPTPTQSQALAKARSDALLANKKRYRRVIGFGLGAAALAAAMAGMPLIFSLGLFALGAAAWAVLKAV